MTIEVVVPWTRTIHEIDDIIVVHVDLMSHVSNESCAFSWLDKKEQDRWHRYRYDRRRREFALCRAALRSILCARLGCSNAQLTFGAYTHGKPFALVSGVTVPVSFNVSHSGNHGLIAFSQETRLGIDVEERVTRQDLDGIITTVFGVDERAELAAAQGYQKLRLFFTLWTLKEALIKALGTGFALDPSRFEIPRTMRQGAGQDTFRFPHLPAVEWKLENLGNADFAAAIAHESTPSASPERDSGKTEFG